jgi:hypothetical protein
MTIEARDRLISLVMGLFSIFGGVYLARFLWAGLTRGFVPGKLGAIHHAWSASYTVSVAASIFAIGLCIALFIMALRWAGLVGRGKDESRPRRP